MVGCSQLVDESFLNALEYGRKSFCALHAVLFTMLTDECSAAHWWLGSWYRPSRYGKADLGTQ